MNVPVGIMVTDHLNRREIENEGSIEHCVNASVTEGT